MKKKVFIITGEVSGDKHASGVARELMLLNPDVEIEAVGGENLRKAGVKLFHNHDKMGADRKSTRLNSSHMA